MHTAVHLCLAHFWAGWRPRPSAASLGPLTAEAGWNRAGKGPLQAPLLALPSSRPAPGAQGTLVHKDLLDGPGVHRCACWRHTNFCSFWTRPVEAGEVLGETITLQVDPGPQTQSLVRPDRPGNAGRRGETEMLPPAQVACCDQLVLQTGRPASFSHSSVSLTLTL